MLMLFITFFKIGILTFGGGYAMIPLMEKEIIIGHGWLSQAQFLNIVAIAEMTPGPIAINAATFIGYKLYGVAGAALATLGVISPSLIIMTIFSHLLARFKASKYGVALKGVSVGVVALIAAAVISLSRSIYTPELSEVLASAWEVPIKLGIAGVTLFLVARTKLNPIWILLLAGLAGILLF
jgi:chromate transporter